MKTQNKRLFPPINRTLITNFSTCCTIIYRTTPQYYYMYKYIYVVESVSICEILLLRVREKDTFVLDRCKRPTDTNTSQPRTLKLLAGRPAEEFLSRGGFVFNCCFVTSITHTYPHTHTYI